MIEVISSRERDRLAGTLERIRSRNVAFDGHLLSQVSAIMQEVRARGDAALIEYAARFDGCVLQPAELRVEEGVLRRTASRLESNAKAGEILVSEVTAQAARSRYQLAERDPISVKNREQPVPLFEIEWQHAISSA